APRYDLLNHLLSLNIDRSWRRRAVGRLDWEGRAPGLFLDACAGTLDLAAELANRRGFSGKVVATDFAPPMLRRGAGKGAAGAVRVAAADALALPFRDRTFDGVMVGFGVRNLEDLDAGLRELHRVLKESSRLVILDFTVPPSALLRAFYFVYFRGILPLVGRLISRHPTAYHYLPASVAEFPPPTGLARRMEGAGFRDCDFRLLTGGIAAIHWGQR
ncbi:MAG: ubiquinone/menaquinone biosynthesis methyltransferase, partial [Gemmatimonadales bacterium]